MNPSTLAFVPVPGGPELLIILFMLVLYVGIPFLIVVAALAFYNGWKNDAEEGEGSDEQARRIEELEREVESLKRDREQ